MQDLPGKAIYDFHFTTARKKLFVHDQFGPKVEMPVSYYFRSLKKMPELEQKAITRCRGKVLDIGAAAGSHTLEIQKKGLDVSAIEISPSACEVMKARGVQHIFCEDFFEFHGPKFDTLLLLMNGIGISSTLDGFRKFLKKAETLLNEGGQIIFDSCDISYMYEDTEMPAHHYYGEAKCRYEYSGQLTDWFEWLYLDKITMQKIAAELDFHSEIIFEDEHSQYLAVLTKST
ncbi:SAM-dependent methyltransferase [Flavobacteriaceae bacterium JJC]|nr:SAM-dependent methyltransferase [Flavobacteriaceae bacterium JJC]